MKVLTDIPSRKRLLGKPGRRCEGNIRIYLKEIGVHRRIGSGKNSLHSL